MLAVVELDATTIVDRLIGCTARRTTNTKRIMQHDLIASAAKFAARAARLGAPLPRPPPCSVPLLLRQSSLLRIARARRLRSATRLVDRCAPRP